MIAEYDYEADTKIWVHPTLVKFKKGYPLLSHIEYIVMEILIFQR